MTEAFGQLPEDARITAAMISDALDTVGLRDQAFLDRFTPVQPGQRAIGYARTARFVPADDIDPAKPYDAAIDFIDGTQPGELIVIATDNSNASAFWGELFSAAAKGRGAVGVLTDGNVRDVDKIREVGFAAYSRSRRPVDFKGRMVLVESQRPVKIGGVSIAPGDLVAIDDDGGAVVPQANEAAVVAAARARAKAESTVLSELLAGATLREVWTRHGIL
jgi:4-hydroxy-4-methyl-2-oxoglutarate aldolase